MTRRSFLNPILGGQPELFQLRNETTGAIVADRVLTAFDSSSRRTGLLKHRGLPDGTALIMAPTNAIHTFFMRFAIDVVFVARDGRVVKTRPTLGPWRMAAALRAHAVVELAAGALATSTTSPGDRLVVVARPIAAS